MVQKAPLDFLAPVWSSHTLSASLYGRTLPQNVYGAEIAAQSVPRNPGPVPFFDPPGITYDVEAGVIYAAAVRGVYEYAPLQTATMEELTLLIRRYLLTKNTPTFGQPSYQMWTFGDQITLSRQDEDTLVGGGVVEYPYTIPSTQAPFTRCFWWRIQTA
jgi:hypothetical protein